VVEPLTALLAAVPGHTTNGVIAISRPNTDPSMERKKSRKRNWQEETEVIDHAAP
jgi:hypothetical protein